MSQVNPYADTIIPQEDPESLYKLVLNKDPKARLYQNVLSEDLYIPVRRCQLRRDAWDAVCEYARFEWERITSWIR